MFRSLNPFLFSDFNQSSKFYSWLNGVSRTVRSLLIRGFIPVSFVTLPMPKLECLQIENCSQSFTSAMLCNESLIEIKLVEGLPENAVLDFKKLVYYQICKSALFLMSLGKKTCEIGVTIN